MGERRRHKDGNEMTDQAADARVDAIHQFFGLSYANYLVLPRSVLQSMPDEWQRRFVKCLEELDETIDWRPKGDAFYLVGLKKEKKRDPYQFEPHGSDIQLQEVDDPFDDYERGRRRIPHRPKLEDETS